MLIVMDFDQWLGPCNPCAYIIMYELLNVRDVVNLALGMRNVFESRSLLLGYAKLLTRHVPHLMELFEDQDQVASLIRLMRWFRWIPTQGLCADDNTGRAVSWILTSYSARFLPWYSRIVPHIQATLLYAYRIEIHRDIIVGLGRDSVITCYTRGIRVWMHIESPRHTFDHPTKPSIVCATFASKGGIRGDSWDMPMNRNLAQDEDFRDALKHKTVSHRLIPHDILNHPRHGIRCLVFHVFHRYSTIAVAGGAGE